MTQFPGVYGMQSSLSLANCEPLDISSARPIKCVAAVSEISEVDSDAGFPEKIHSGCRILLGLHC